MLRLRYDDYVKCLSEHHLIRVKALMEVPGDNKPVMTVANIPLSMPELLVEVGTHCAGPDVKGLLSFTSTKEVMFSSPLSPPHLCPSHLSLLEILKHSSS